MKTIRIGSRESALAVAQSQLVIEGIKKYDPTIQIELITMTTSGDQNLDINLDKIGGKGLFVKELDTALLENRVDITVHSFKDMPIEIHLELPIVALSKREDPRDVLMLPIGCGDPSKPIGCSSNRRKIQLFEMGHFNIEPIRGNVLTRLKKLDEHEYRAIILAAAGLKRLHIESRIHSYFSTTEMVPSACQGIIAVQARRGENTDFLSAFHDEESAIVSTAERAFIQTLNGGCSSPVAAFAVIDQGTLLLNGIYVEETTGKMRKASLRGEIHEAKNIGVRLANLLREGCTRQ